MQPITFLSWAKKHHQFIYQKTTMNLKTSVAFFGETGQQYDTTEKYENTFIMSTVETNSRWKFPKV